MDVSEKLTRRERERRRRRRLILDSARGVFAERGYQNATLEEVAERSEFGKGTLYNYFEGGKEDILFAVFDEIFTEIRAMIRDGIVVPYREGRSLREVVAAHVRRTFKRFLEERDLLMIMVKESQRLIFSESREKAAYFHRQHRAIIDLLVPVLQEAMDNDEIKQLPPESVAYMVHGNVEGFLSHLCMQEEGNNYANVTDAGVTDNGAPPQPIDLERAAHVLVTVLFDGLQANDPRADERREDAPQDSPAPH